MRRIMPFAAVVIAALAIAGAPVAHARPVALATAFTYQGQLKSSGAPLNGTADFQVALFNAPTAGIQITVTAQVGQQPARLAGQRRGRTRRQHPRNRPPAIWLNGNIVGR